MTGDDDRNRESASLGDGDLDTSVGESVGDEEPARPGRGRRGDRRDEPPPPGDPLLDDDPKPRDTLFSFKVSKARAETGKPIEPILEAIALEDPAHINATRAIEAAYEAATAQNDSPDNLLNQYCEADLAFREAARYLMAKAPRQERSLIERWIDRNLRHEGAPVRRILIARRHVEARLRARAGPRELALRDARENTGRWKTAWDNWRNPVKNIGDIIKSYKDRIGALKDLSNDKATADEAILEFWFEVAPRHFGLRSECPTEEEAPGIKLVRAELEDFEDVQARLSSGRSRHDGSLYLINADRLAGKRERVLEAWRKAAEEEAEAQADYDLRPDDAAKLGERHGGLEGDKWLGRAKAILGPPTAK